MKFNKQINNGTLLIPGGAFKISGFEGGERSRSTRWTARWSF